MNCRRFSTQLHQRSTVQNTTAQIANIKILFYSNKNIKHYFQQFVIYYPFEYNLIVHLLRNRYLHFLQKKSHKEWYLNIYFLTIKFMKI